MRRHSAQRAPCLGELDHVLTHWPALELECQPCRLLQRKVAGGPGIRVSQAKQEINVRGPRPDAVQGGERDVGIVGLHAGERAKIDRALRNRAGDGLHGLDLRPGEPDARELDWSRAPDRIMVKGVERRTEPSPDGGGARGRELLRANDGAQAGESGRPAPQRRPSGDVEQPRKARVCRRQGCQGRIEIGVVTKKMRGHELPCKV